ncbi:MULTISPECIES: hypothetical protein [Acinetobacter calcoaceticus/baumannii complex]|uniref:hypothetical protein n=1 Tax=Acinetobacter calcoaceticus/baumannii complex TaxID=909768 RepID=UPI0002D0F6BF|nr:MULTISPECIES: hypothetical protein [Acinetobacter calcoaceticus/baumannii complex]ENU47173.1 hypothetical protein F984_01542 [Acinetobacter nosocomialis NIPH 2119]EXR26100.1 hypothetical protein J689_3478 [Acinetobacter sp. 1179249]MBJ8465862.1 hypothetical protein [Acinetobacter nosocomialis]MBP1499386.1 hypothetical protein [Acinetobacter nosocomialis]MCG9292025.1 hypothetical protein [Acinetobacter nosocomialis]
MIKKILLSFIAIFTLVSGLIIFYWRDVQYNPDKGDFFLYFLLLPAIITLAILSPWLIYSVYKSYKEKKEKVVSQSQNDDSQKQTTTPDQPLEQLDFHIYSAFAIHALGENETIIKEIQDFKSPELDDQLLNSYGLPLLSYRIKDLAESDEEDFEYAASPRQIRIMSLIRQQLEQNIENLYRLAEHLKRSILFYESHQIREYHMHPAWVDPNSEYEDTETPVVEVHRLNRLNLHILLPEDLLHIWNDEQSNDLILEFFTEIGIISQKVHIEYHFLGERVAYQEFIHLLKRIQKKEHEIFLVLAVDSEIDQDLIDEKSWMVKDYIPAEFATSCLIADPSLKIEELEPAKNLKVVIGQEKTAKVLNILNLNELPQYEGDEPYVLIVSDQTDIKAAKHLQQQLTQTSVEPHHFIYVKSSLGHTQHLVDIYGFMLSMHFPEHIVPFVFGENTVSAHTFVQSVTENSEDDAMVLNS